ncbi:MAG: prepilin-type N-terminal cleavage/methylation domain-containing protein [bacterium]
MIKNYKQGISVIELLVVIAVLGIMFLIIFPQFSKMRENQVLKSTIGDVMSNLNKAKSQTLASMNSSQYGVHFQSDRVIIFKGITFSANDVNNVTTNITTPATISNVTLAGVSGNSGDMYFNRLSGTPDKTGTVTVSTTSFSKIITISATGSMSVN